MDWKSVLSGLAARLREPSTYAGLALLIGAVFRFTPSGDDVKEYSDIGTGVAAVIAIVLHEKGNQPTITVKALPPVEGGK